MDCPKCGAMNHDSERVCRMCGKSLPGANQADTGAPSAYPPPVYQGQIASPAPVYQPQSPAPQSPAPQAPVDPLPPVYQSPPPIYPPQAPVNSPSAPVYQPQPPVPPTPSAQMPAYPPQAPVSYPSSYQVPGSAPYAPPPPIYRPPVPQRKAPVALIIALVAAVVVILGIFATVGYVTNNQSSSSANSFPDYTPPSFGFPSFPTDPSSGTSPSITPVGMQTYISRDKTFSFQYDPGYGELNEDSSSVILENSDVYFEVGWSAGATDLSFITQQDFLNYFGSDYKNAKIQSFQQTSVDGYGAVDISFTYIDNGNAVFAAVKFISTKDMTYYISSYDYSKQFIYKDNLHTWADSFHFLTSS